MNVFGNVLWQFSRIWNCGQSAEHSVAHSSHIAPDSQLQMRRKEEQAHKKIIEKSLKSLVSANNKIYSQLTDIIVQD